MKNDLRPKTAIFSYNTRKAYRRKDRKWNFINKKIKFRREKRKFKNIITRDKVKLDAKIDLMKSKEQN